MRVTGGAGVSACIDHTRGGNARHDASHFPDQAMQRDERNPITKEGVSIHMRSGLGAKS